MELRVLLIKIFRSLKTRALLKPKLTPLLRIYIHDEQHAADIDSA